MSLEFFRKKRFQRRHPDVFCQRMALTIPCVSSLRVTPHQILKSFHCSLQLDQLGTSRRKNFSEQFSRSSSRQGVPTFVQTPPGFQTFSRSRPRKDVQRFSFHEGRQHCVQLICQHSQCVHEHHNFSRCVCFRRRCRLSFHGPHQDVSRSLDVRSRRTSCPRYEITFRILHWRRLAKKSRVHQGRIGSCWIRRGYHCRTHRLREGLWQLRQCLDEALMLSLLLLHLLQRLVQLLILSSHLSQLRNELFGVHLLVRCLPRSLLCLLTQALSSRPEHPTTAAPLP